MSDQPLVDAEIKREGGLSDDPVDKGGLTYKGISSKANPDLFKDGLPSDEQVHKRYEDRYIVGPGFDKLVNPQIQSLMVDWGVNSGPSIAITALQQILGLKQDGILGSKSLSAVNAADPAKVIPRLVAERVKMIGRIISKNPSQVKYINGWLARALEWLG